MPAPAGITPRWRKLNSGVTAPRLSSAVNDIVPAPPWTAGDDRKAAGSVCTMRCGSATGPVGPCARTGIRVIARTAASRGVCLMVLASVHAGRVTKSPNLGLDGPHGRFAHHVQHIVVRSPEGETDRILRHRDGADGGA